MREMAQYTKVAPAGRIDRLLAFNQRLQQSNESSRHLTDWSLGLDPELVKIPARILPYPQIIFGNDKRYAFHLLCYAKNWKILFSKCPCDFINAKKKQFVFFSELIPTSVLIGKANSVTIRWRIASI